MFFCVHPLKLLDNRSLYEDIDYYFLLSVDMSFLIKIHSTALEFDYLSDPC